MSPRQQATRRIRTAVATGSVAMFLALFGGIYAQASSTETAASSSSSAATSSAATGNAEQAAVATMTTRQS